MCPVLADVMAGGARAALHRKPRVRRRQGCKRAGDGLGCMCIWAVWAFEGYALLTRSALTVFPRCLGIGEYAAACP